MPWLQAFLLWLGQHHQIFLNCQAGLLLEALILHPSNLRCKLFSALLKVALGRSRVKQPVSFFIILVITAMNRGIMETEKYRHSAIAAEGVTMVEINAFDDANLPASPQDTPPEEILLSQLVDPDGMDPDGEEILNGNPNSAQRTFKLHMPNHIGADVTGGDLDDDWYQAEVVGEEAVGGDNPTPDQNVTEYLQRSMGIASADGESVRTHNKLEQRDRDRWELNPASAEDYPERE